MAQTEEKKEKLTAGKLEYMRKKDNEMVKGIFKFYEVPGGSVSFCFRKYKGDPILKYTMLDGQIYTVPRMVAKHLNNNCWYPEYDYIKGEPGTQNMYGVKNKVHRMGFQSLEFIDDDMQNEGEQKIIEVTKV